MANAITIEAMVMKDCGLVWDFWNNPKHIEHWLHASDDWECTQAVNDLQVGGHFAYTLARKDGSESFVLSGTYTTIEQNKFIACTLDDGRDVAVTFEMRTDIGTYVTQSFEPEHVNSIEDQRGGWEAILTNFKTYAEGN